MRYIRIPVMITALFLCLLSCRETIVERHDSPPKENSNTPSTNKEQENPEKKKDANTPAQKLQEKDIKKKKQKATDTLKPKMAALEELQ